MEYKTYLTEHIDELVEYTNCSDELRVKLIQKGIIVWGEEEDLSTTRLSAEKNKRLWGYLLKKKDKMEIYVEIFTKLKQEIVVDILKNAMRDGECDFLKNETPLVVSVARPREQLSHEDDLYKLDPRIIGLALVINITRFENEKSRKGAENDTKYMKDLWSALGYQVSTHEGVFDQSRLNEVIAEFLDLFQLQPTQMSCVVYIGTHGSNGKFELSNGTKICAYKDFIDRFTKDPILGEIKNGVTKPKIFITQSCQIFADNEEKTLDLSHITDTIVCYPCAPGETANRDTLIGSLFVYKFTQVFMQNAYKTEFTEMLKMVRREMINETNDGDDQVPWWRNFDLKPLYFNVAPMKK